MLKRLVLLCSLAALCLPGASQAILLGNHQLTLDLIGTTQYFEFADFTEYQFPEQGLDWGFRLDDMGDPNDWPIDIDYPIDSPYQNRNRIQMRFEGNLDIGARLRTALSPHWGIEGYVKYTPVDLVLVYNGTNLPEANFTRYSGVTNPEDPESQLNWVLGDYPTYHVLRFGANIDYVYYRSPANTMNLYGSLGLGAISYFRKGQLLVPADYDENEQDVPSAPVDVSYWMPNDTYLSANLGAGAIVYLHRLFGLNFDLRFNWTPFHMNRAQEDGQFGSFESQHHWIISGSIGYTVRFG